MVSLARLVLLFAVLVALAPQWLPLPGAALVIDEPLAAADAALVLDAVGTDALDGAEHWRQQGLVRHVVIVEAPVKTHALTAYWTDFVRWGLARPSTTPPEYLRVVRASGGQPADQARAARDALRELGARSVLAPGGGIGSRLTQRELSQVLQPAGIQVRLSRMAPPRYDPSRWYQAAEGRRAVLDQWLQMLVPYLAGS